MEFLGASPLTGQPPVSERLHLLFPLPGALSDHTIKWQTLEPLLKHQTSLTKTKSQPMEWLSNINKLQIYMIFENHVHDKRLISRINRVPKTQKLKKNTYQNMGQKFELDISPYK